MKDFLKKLKENPRKISFEETIHVIDTCYNFTPTTFSNGEINNPAGKNNGSCKLFAFAQLHDLTEQETLYCFGEHYAHVLETPYGNDHQNIRNFMKTGWSEIVFSSSPLKLKNPL